MHRHCIHIHACCIISFKAIRNTHELKAIGKVLYWRDFFMYNIWVTFDFSANRQLLVHIKLGVKVRIDESVNGKIKY